MVDIILGPLIGGLTHGSAKVWARADGPATLYAWYGQKADLSDAKLAGKTRLIDGNGFSAVVPLTGLADSTRYFYTLTLKPGRPAPSLPEGHRLRDGVVDGASEAGPAYPSFQTFPLPGQRVSFNFSFGSCFLPGRDGAGIIFDALDKRRIKDNLSFILMIGDQIYADPPRYNGLGRGAVTLDDYRQVYLNNWSNPHFRNLLTNLPAFMMLDDHEVDNDWHWDNKVRRWAYLPFYELLLRWLKRRPLDELFLTIHRVRDAMQAYWEHQGIHASDYVRLPKMDASGRFMFHEDDGFFAYTFQVGAVPFFVLDTRTTRVENARERHILSEVQWQALEKWLLDHRAAPLKFLVSSSTMMFDMLLDISRDRWGGFPQDRDRLLKFIADHEIHNLYVLSGDIHNAHCIETELRGPNGPVKFWEFCSTPFEQGVNLIAFTYFRPWNRLIARQKLHAKVVAQNFGVVKVDFTEDSPRVRYEIYGQDGRLLFPSS
jgi:alkaline phosphatase D